MRKGEIDGRIDAGFYEPRILSFIKYLEQLPHTQKLKSFIKSLYTGINNTQNECGNGLRFLRTQNVRPVNLDFQDSTFTADEQIRIAKKGTLLFTRIGVNVGDVAFNKIGDFAFSDNVICAELANDSLAYYAAIFLSTEKGKILLERQKRDTARPIISYENIKNLLLPILEEDVQKKIIENFEIGYQTKLAKEAEAKELLAGIDAYLLAKLGIASPTQTTTKKIFYTSATKVSGSRLDSYYYQPLYIEVYQNLQNSYFGAMKLRDVSTKIISGLDSREFVESGTPYLRVGNVKPLSFDLSDVKFIPPIESNKDIQLLKNDLLITRKGSFGNAVIVDESVLGSVISSEVFRIPLRSNVNPHYVAFWLNTKIAQTIFDRIKTGGIMGHITQEVLSAFLIPLPPLEIQNEIASYIQTVREKAKRLELEAAATIEQAKAEVERMILGA